MSMNPNSPYEPNPNAPGSIPNAGFGQAPPPKKSTAKYWVIGCGLASVLGMLVCCGGPLLMTQFGISVMAGEFQKQLDGNPTIVEHIGDIESFSMSWSATMQEAQNADGQAGELAFEIEGSKGSGRVLIKQDQSGDGTGIQSATLVMEDGQRYPIDLGNAADPADIDLNEFVEEGDLDLGLEPTPAQ